MRRSLKMLELAVLGLLKERPIHGYQLSRELGDSLGGLWRVSYGSLYPTLRRLERDGVILRGEQAGDGPPIVLLHGLSATRRNVVQGSRHLIKRGYRLIAYDARGHGASSPGRSYEYPELVDDLEAVLDHLGIERAALVGSSMGAATAMAFTLEHPERVAALVQITPAYTGYARTGNVDGDSWERMASELERGGVDAFVDVAQPDGLRERWREIAREATRQRMERHDDPSALAAAQGQGSVI
jgi:pimeloyl-ACP methyl ester carboxylesterase